MCLILFSYVGYSSECHFSLVLLKGLPMYMNLYAFPEVSCVCHAVGVRARRLLHQFTHPVAAVLSLCGQIYSFFFFFCHVEELASVDVTRLVSLYACYFPSVLTYPLHLWLFLAFRCLCDCAVATTHFQVRCSRAPAGQRNNVVAAYIWQTWASLLTSYTLQLACHSCLMCAPGWAGKSGMSAALS